MPAISAVRLKEEEKDPREETRGSQETQKDLQDEKKK